MKHFYEDIQGWFNFQQLYYTTIKSARPNSHFVEVGAWKGRSTAYMAVEIANSGLNIQFDVVDTWQGSEEHNWDPYVQTGTLYEHFLGNLAPCKPWVRPLRMTSLEAATQYPDQSLDFVLLDASHDYANVRADILAWLPKVRPGGILAGDDYRDDWPGVRQAVDELLPSRELLDAWVYRKPMTELNPGPYKNFIL